MLFNLILQPVFAQSAPQTSSELMQDASFRTAVDQVAQLRLSLFDFKDRLAKMDKLSKEKNKGELEEQYKEVRSEMVKVIQDIDFSTQKITRTLKALYAYKLQLQEQLQALKETKQHLEVGKKYLSQLLLLVYKMEREIYTEEGEQIDALKLFVKSDAMPQLLAGDETLKMLLNQINTLLKEATTQEEEKSGQIQRLIELKVQSQKSLDYYKNEIKKLEQKKAYLISFMQMYNEKKLTSATT